MNLWNPGEAAVLLWSEFCVRLTQSLWHFLWQGAAIGLTVLASDRLLRRAPSQWRYGASTLGLLTMLCCVPATYLTLGNFRNQLADDPTNAISAPARPSSGHNGHSAAIAPAERDIQARDDQDSAPPPPLRAMSMAGPGTRRFRSPRGSLRMRRSAICSA